VDLARVARAYAETYAGEPFVYVVAPPRYPDVKNVVGSNLVEVGYAVEKRVGRVTGFAAIDNLVKGAAGQAIQAFNVSHGLPEDTGLKLPPLRP
jgi:N-acetyl-gamma-glutamyl-phosphate/LysW-gamma-L-alpha-aminoadipyl-6-phosphate reductase